VSRTVVVKSGVLRYSQNISVGSHVLHADEPGDSGGNDFWPNPYELLLAALGACTSMTVRMYAERKQWPLESVEVRLAHSKFTRRNVPLATPRKACSIELKERSLSLVICLMSNGTG
jgi:uncharacterized OsmC-like protein